MKKHLKLLLPIAAISACIAWASVSTDYDHKADFSRYHTYYWIGVKAGNSLWQDRIMNAVNAQLAAKAGLYLRAPATPGYRRSAANLL